MTIKRLRGMHDLYGNDAVLFQKMEEKAREVFGRFDFKEIRTPILEEKELFSRALGTDTDVVQKEMYEFTDRSKIAVAMRPEGTAGVVRAYLENEFDKKEGLCKFYYMGAMFRSERPQAGRLRQFHQIGVEQLGTDSPYADAETIHALVVFLESLGVTGYRVKLNNLGTFEERRDFKQKLKEYFEPIKNKLCGDCKERLKKNVFRILDCKVEECRKIIVQSPPISEFLTSGSVEYFAAVQRALKSAGIEYAGDPYMVRGLDYYTKTVFEITHPKLGAQDALAAGGRYDRLIESFGGASAGAVGFALGMERLAMCLKEDGNSRENLRDSIFIVALGEAALGEAFKLLSAFRASGIPSRMEFSSKSMKSQMRSADKEKCAYALILGENELKSGQLLLKNMKDGSQESVGTRDILGHLKRKLGKP
jgi:histidyl-tRNA synthetase